MFWYDCILRQNCLWLFLFFFLSSSYINQRNRSWNIVESEKALVVSVHLLKHHLWLFDCNDENFVVKLLIIVLALLYFKWKLCLKYRMWTRKCALFTSCNFCSHWRGLTQQFYWKIIMEGSVFLNWQQCVWGDEFCVSHSNISILF